LIYFADINCRGSRTPEFFAQNLPKSAKSAKVSVRDSLYV